MILEDYCINCNYYKLRLLEVLVFVKLDLHVCVVLMLYPIPFLSSL